MKKRDLKCAFFGTPDIAVYVLEELKAAGFTPALIVTAPDRPAGRTLTPTPPAAKLWAEAQDIGVSQPEKLTKEDPEAAVIFNTEWDLFVVAAYGQIMPREVLDIPTHGTLNVHPSLLPQLRGASPIRSAILEDKRVTGVTIMKMDEQMDHGPIVAQARVELEADEWPPRGRMFDELLARAGGELLAETIPAWVAGEIEAEVQDHNRASFTKKITKAMGELDLNDDPYQNLLKIRAFDGWPGTFFFVEKNGKRVRIKVTDAECASDGTLKILRVIPEGKNEMDYEQFKAAYQ